MISRKGAQIPAFLAMELSEEALRLESEGANVIPLAVGEPDFDTPDCVKEAAARALRDGHTHYTHSLGLLDLRQAICEHYWDRYKVQITPDRIMVTSGTSPAFMLLFSAILDPDDEVVLSNPHYACYPNYVSFAGGRPVYVNTYAADGYQLRANAVLPALSSRTKAILINSPGNPTGTVMSEENFAAIANLGKFVVSDEIYHGLVYEGREHSILEFTDRACVLNGFSKLYAMTGWRLGYVIAPPELIRIMQKLHQNFFISANAFVQWAGLAALREARSDVARMVATYAKRRLFILERVRSLGFDVPSPPTGAFYVLIDARKYGGDSLAMAYDILKEVHVAVTPGIDFGSNAEGHLRLSYATSIDKLDEGMTRLGRYFAKR